MENSLTTMQSIGRTNRDKNEGFKVKVDFYDLYPWQFIVNHKRKMPRKSKKVFIKKYGIESYRLWCNFKVKNEHLKELPSDCEISEIPNLLSQIKLKNRVMDAANLLTKMSRYCTKDEN